MSFIENFLNPADDETTGFDVTSPLSDGVQMDFEGRILRRDENPGGDPLCLYTIEDGARWTTTSDSLFRAIHPDDEHEIVTAETIAGVPDTRNPDIRRVLGVRYGGRHGIDRIY